MILSFFNYSQNKSSAFLISHVKHSMRLLPLAILNFAAILACAIYMPTVAAIYAVIMTLAGVIQEEGEK